RACHHEQVLIHAAERRDGSLHEEGSRDECLREHHRGSGEGERDAMAVEKGAEEAAPAEREQETNAGHGGRDHGGDLRDRFQPARKAARVPRHPPREKRSQHYDDREAARGGDEGEAQGGREQRIAKPAEEVAPAQGGEERHDGQEEEQSQRHRREKLCRLPRRCARLHVSFPARKPWRESTSRPTCERTSSTNCFASAGWLVLLTTAIGYSATTLTSEGIGITSTLSLAVLASVR